MKLENKITHLNIHFQNYSEHTCLPLNSRSGIAAHKTISV